MRVLATAAAVRELVVSAATFFAIVSKVTSTATIAAAPIAAPTTLFAFAGFVDFEGTAVYIFAVEGVDDGVGGRVLHFDKTKATETAGVAVVNHGY